MAFCGRSSKLCAFLIVLTSAALLLISRHSYVRNTSYIQPKESRTALHSDNSLPGERNVLHSARLDDNYTIPNNVFYVWCGSKRHFEFRHYLSVLSVIHFLQPDDILLYYDEEPVVDRYHYHTWLAEVAARYPFFRTQRETAACVSNSTFVQDRLSKDGGMYIDDRVVLTKPGHYLRRSLSVVAVDNNDATVVRMSAVSQSSAERHTDAEAFRCVTASSYEKQPFNDDGSFCVAVDRAIRPKDIWELDNRLGRLLRTVAYGNPDLARPQPSYDELIPNIGHVVWIGGGVMRFDFFLCVLSFLYVAKVDTLFIHGQAPSGYYWELIRENPRIKVVHRTLKHVYGNSKPTAHFAHISDICRVDVLLRYGGIYIDVDALFVRPLSREIRGYDAVASVDIKTAMGTRYPDTISNGVMAGKPNARFWRLFLESMKNYDEKLYYSMGIMNPYKIKERYPNTLLIEPHLQVLCNEGNCRPTWTPHYQNASFNERTTDVLRNWKNDTFVFHFTFPVPAEFKSPVALLSMKGMIADMGWNVLEQSGMLAMFQRLTRNESFNHMVG